MSTQLLTLVLDDEQPFQTHQDDGDHVLVTSREGIKVIATIKNQKIMGLYATHSDGHRGTINLMRMADHGPNDGPVDMRANICYVCVDRYDGSRRCFRIPCELLSDVWV